MQKNKLSKDEFISLLAKSSNFTKKDCEMILSKISEVIIQALKDKKEISFGSLGAFKYKTSKARTCNVIKTGQSIQIPAKGGASFKLNKKTKDSLSDII